MVDTHTIEQMAAFLRMAAIELARIAEAEPGIAVRLRHIAGQCEAQSAELRRGLELVNSP